MAISRLAFAGSLVALVASGLFGAPAASAAPSSEATNAINERFTEFGGSQSMLGNPTGEATDIAGGAERDYQGGAIFYSPETGAKVMYGGILDKFRSLGGPATIGFPKNDESSAGDGTGRFNEFATPGGAAIYWSPATGASIMQGQVLDAWKASGGIEGPFGYPTADTAVVNGVETGMFAGPGGTEINWSEQAGLSTLPPELAASLPGFRANAEGGVVVPAPVPNPNVGVPDVNVPNADTPNVSAPDTSSSGINRWWAVPIGLAITAAAGGLFGLLSRRRGGELTTPSMSTPRPNMPSAPRANADAPQWQTPAVGTGGGRHEMREPRRTPSVGDSMPPLTGGRRAADMPSGEGMPGARPLMGAAAQQASARRDVADPKREQLVRENTETGDLVAGEGVEVVYKNNALGADQQSGTDKSAHKS